MGVGSRLRAWRQREPRRVGCSRLARGLQAPHVPRPPMARRSTTESGRGARNPDAGEDSSRAGALRPEGSGPPRPCERPLRSRCTSSTTANWQLAKQVESEVAPGGQARVICLGAFGGNDYPRLPDTGARTIVSAVDHLGRYQEMRLGGYGGCLRSFPDLPFRPRRDT